MDLKKIEQFKDDVANRTNEIKRLKNKVSVVERMENLGFYAAPANDLVFHTFNLTSDNTDESTKKILEVTKVLMLSTLKKKIETKENELNDFIKKGITEND